MTQKLVDGVLVDLSPEEQAEFDKQQAKPRVDPAGYDHGKTIAQAFEETINVKS